MEKAKLFMNGGSQAVRLPKDCRFEGDEVLVNRIGDTVILYPKRTPLEGMLQAIDGFTDDFLREIPGELPFEERDFSWMDNES